jgi:hypothetical protein
MRGHEDADEYDSWVEFCFIEANGFDPAILYETVKQSASEANPIELSDLSPSLFRELYIQLRHRARLESGVPALEPEQIENWKCAPLEIRSYWWRPEVGNEMQEPTIEQAKTIIAHVKKHHPDAVSYNKAVASHNFELVKNDRFDQNHGLLVQGAWLRRCISDAFVYFFGPTGPMWMHSPMQQYIIDGIMSELEDK